MVAPTTPKTYDLRGVIVRAKDLVDDVLVDPILPAGFEETDNKLRPFEQAVWWGVPFIRTHQPKNPTAEFLSKFPTGTSFTLRCLDGGAWDRSTWWGEFATIGEAVAEAKRRPTYAVMRVTVV